MRLVCLLFFLLPVILPAQKSDAPFSVNIHFDLTQPKTLGLSRPAGIETFPVFSPGENDNQYNHGVVLFPFKGMLYAQWQSSSKDEDAQDTRVYFSRSENGKIWSKPVVLTNEWSEGIKTSGGWWSNGDTLIAYVCNWPFDIKPKGGFTTYMISTDGIHWSEEKPVTDQKGNPVKGIIEQDVHSLPDGRILTAFHLQPGLQITPFFTDDPSGITGWTQGKIQRLPAKKDMSRELEPAWFYKHDGTIVMIFRDQQSTFKKLASVSKDRGKTWTTPVIIDTPDSRAKQSAGNLPDGSAFMVNNPSGNKDRFPLVIVLSKNGNTFDKAFLLRSGDEDLQPMRHEGKYKRIGFSYPKSVVWGDYLYVSYATNKEDVELTRIPIAELVY